MENKHDIQLQFVELRAKGNSYDRIADNLGVSKGTLIEWSKQMYKEISNLKSIETDALLGKHRMARIHQLEIFGSQLNKIREELDKRDLSDVSTDKLLSMELKIIESINNGGSDIKFLTSDLFLGLPENTWCG